MINLFMLWIESWNLCYWLSIIALPYLISVVAIASWKGIATCCSFLGRLIVSTFIYLENILLGYYRQMILKSCFLPFNWYFAFLDHESSSHCTLQKNLVFSDSRFDYCRSWHHRLNCFYVCSMQPVVRSFGLQFAGLRLRYSWVIVIWFYSLMVQSLAFEN